MIGVLFGPVAVIWLVIATFDDCRSRFLAKPLASAAFLLVVALEPLDDTTRATFIVAGLVLGAIGDVVLMARADAAFLVGLGAFLVGHVAYVVAFAADQGASGLVAVGAAVAVVLGAGSLRWLWHRLAGPFRAAVPVYVVVIAVMVALAIGAARSHPVTAVGAVLFAVSDLLVARERFVSSSRWNPVVGLPLYYAGQFLIAVSVVDLG